MNFCTQGRFLKWKPSHNELHICIYWCISRALNFCKQLYITYNIYWMPRCSNACKPLARTKYSHSLVHFYLLLANCLCASLLLMSLSSYLACYFYDTVALRVANTLKCIFCSRSTKNHEKHEHIEHIIGYIMFRHRKLVVVIDITLLDAWWPPFFFW